MSVHHLKIEAFGIDRAMALELARQCILMLGNGDAFSTSRRGGNAFAVINPCDVGTPEEDTDTDAVPS